MPLFGGGGLLGGAGALADEIGQSSEAAGGSAEAYRKPFTVSRFDEFGAASLSQGDEAELARVRTPAGLERRWGFGAANKPDNQGYAYGHFFNSGDGTADSEEQIHGIVSLKWENSTGRRQEVTEELASEDMATADRYNRDEQPPVPEAQGKERAGQDEYLVVTFTPETDPADITNDYAVAADFSEVRLPATEYDVSA